MGSGFKKQISLAMMIIASMTSCLPDPIEVDDSLQPEPKIVVSSEINGNTVNILLSRSIGALDASDDSDWIALLSKVVISDATVRIYTQEGYQFPLTYLGGVYTTFSMPLVVGHTYTLVVNSEKYGTVRASTVLKQRVNFTTLSAKMSVTGRDSLAVVTYSFADEPGPNWYMISGQHLRGSDTRERVLNPRVTTKMVDDTGFDGGIKQDTFKVLFSEVQPGDTLSVMLSNITQEYFNYMQIREDNRFGLAAALGEPINFPTNVEGGLGFFNLYVPDNHTFTLKK